jgi:YVTN family beta-propeller protein
MKLFQSANVIQLILIVSFLSVFLTSCEQDFVETPSGTVEFPDEISQLFNTPYTSNNLSCTTPSCHASENSASGLNLANWQSTMNGSQNGSMAVPYNGFWSYMFSVVNADTNYGPVSTVGLSEYHKLDSAKVSTIKNWIDQGAKSKDGRVALKDQPISEKFFITNQASDLVAVVNSNTKLISRFIPVGGRSNQLDAPHYISLSNDNRFFFVSLIQEGYLEKYDVNTDYPFTRADRTAAGLNPAHIEISPDDMTGYVTNFDASGTQRTVRKFSTSPLQIIDTVSNVRLSAPHGMALNSDGSILFVASQIGEYLFRINTSDFEIETSAPVDPSVPPTGNGTGNFGPYQIVLSPDNNRIFVSLREGNKVGVYDAQNLDRISLIDVGTKPLLMKFTNDGQYLFVCNRNSNTVSVINTSSLTVISTITDVGIQPHGVDFTTDGQYAIIACETQTGFDGHHPQSGNFKTGVSRMIRVSNFTLEDTRLQMGSFPAGIVAGR